MFCGRRFYWRKSSISFFWSVNSIHGLNFYYSMKTALGAILFCKIFHGHLLNQLLWILWPCCDIYGEFKWMFWKNSSNFSLNLSHFLWYLKRISGEKIRKIENQNFVHCLVSMFWLLYENQSTVSTAKR